MKAAGTRGRRTAAVGGATALGLILTASPAMANESGDAPAVAHSWSVLYALEGGDATVASAPVEVPTGVDPADALREFRTAPTSITPDSRSVAYERNVLAEEEALAAEIARKAAQKAKRQARRARLRAERLAEQARSSLASSTESPFSSSTSATSTSTSGPQVSSPIPTASTSKSAQIQSLIKKHFPSSQLGNAMAVAACESGHSDAVGSRNSNGTVDYGVFQLNSPGTLQGALRSIGVSFSSQSDAEQKALNTATNVRAASAIYRDRGWAPWVCAYKIGIVASLYSNTPGSMAGKFDSWGKPTVDVPQRVVTPPSTPKPTPSPSATKKKKKSKNNSKKDSKKKASASPTPSPTKKPTKKPTAAPSATPTPPGPKPTPAPTKPGPTPLAPTPPKPTESVAASQSVAAPRSSSPVATGSVGPSSTSGQSSPSAAASTTGSVAPSTQATG